MATSVKSGFKRGNKNNTEAPMNPLLVVRIASIVFGLVVQLVHIAVLSKQLRNNS